MIILWLLLASLFISFGLIVVVGAPWVPSKKGDLELLFNSLKLRRRAKFIDLGCGDGRVLVAAARQGYNAYGYELNPLLALIAKLRLRKYPQARVKLGNYWQADIKKADVVFVFSAQPYLHRLQQKCQAELKPGALAVLYGFSFGGQKIYKRIGPCNIYKF